MNKYPSSMATQHPDNADKYIAIQNEPEETIHALTSQEDGGLGIEEIMIDFEGKLTPYHQPMQVAVGLIKNGLVPGKDVFITPRIPNAKKEPIFRQLMSIMALVETNALAYKQTQVQAIRESVVPMIESGHELSQLYDRISSVIELGNKNYDVKFSPDSISIIPLLESVPTLVNADKILDEYFKNTSSKGLKTKNIRIMFARSDSAMSYSMLASVLSVLIAINKTCAWGNRNNIEIAPILGCGALPFRGHLTEENLDTLINNYAGIRTYTIQSGIRYDHGESETTRVVQNLKTKIAGLSPKFLTPDDIELMKHFIGISVKHYVRTFIKLIDKVNKVAQYMPKNRDRLSSTKTGLEYIREIACMQEIADLVSDAKLKEELLAINTDIESAVPRAISFTASLYTLGLPPEFIGIGRALNEIKEKYGGEGISKLLSFYPQLTSDLTFASKFVNTRISRGIIDESARSEYQEDCNMVCEILNICQLDYEDNGSNESSEVEFYHTLLRSVRPILLHLLGKQIDLFSDSREEQKILNEWIIKMGKIRGSLG